MILSEARKALRLYMCIEKVFFNSKFRLRFLFFASLGYFASFIIWYSSLRYITQR